MMTEDILIEIGCEELPPKQLPLLADAFQTLFVEALTQHQLAFETIKIYATPRRLGLHIISVATKQPTRAIEKKGPPVASGMKEGVPQPALIGFAKSCGVEIDDLTIHQTDKGDWYVYQHTLPGQLTADLIPKLLQEVINQLPIAKRMRWGDYPFEFVRPVRWLVVLQGNQILPCELFGIQAGRHTYGHRVHAPHAIPINTPSEYASVLQNQGYVIAEFEVRQTLIHHALQQHAKAHGQVIIPNALLQEVTALVEWPVIHVGSFEQRFLDVPQEALISTMQDNQKYFPIVDDNGKLQAHFCFVANIDSPKPEAIIAGNERVIRPRFSDAEFFWQTDLKHPLIQHSETLKTVVFQTKLGTQADKVQRVGRLAQYLCHVLPNADADAVERATVLSKCDLLTNMVQEFPELQGIMGRYYAEANGENTLVAHCLEQYYWPRFAGDQLPTSTEASILAIAERIDTLTGIFAIGQAPTGSKDPYSLRRSALGVLRIIIENALELDLKPLVQLSADTMPTEVNAHHVLDEVIDYLTERMKGYCLEQGIRADVFESVQRLKLSRPLDMFKRMQAVQHFLKAAEVGSLSNANKRIQNILRKNATTPLMPPTQMTGQEHAETQLLQTVRTLEQTLQPLVHAQDYGAILSQLSQLAEPLENFFNDVMVMCDDQTIRLERLGLLQWIATLFDEIADISALQMNY